MNDVRVRFVGNDEELRQANGLMALSRGEDHFDVEEWLTFFGGGYPGYQREHTRIAVCGSQVVAALRLTTDTIRIGEARLKMGGLGWISTDSAWERRGIASLVMNDTLRYMQEQRYHVSMIFGVSETHRRWGFAPALEEHATLLDICEAETRVPDRPLRVRPAKPGDIQAMQKLHLANDVETACSIIRTQAHMANLWRQWEKARVLTNARGKVAAYFHGARNGSEYAVDEAGVAERDGCAGIVDAVARLARNAGTERLRFDMPPTHPLVRHLKEEYRHDALQSRCVANGMMAFVNLGEALESMIPEWESRLLQSPAARAHAEITLLPGKNAWRVRAHHGAINVTPGSGLNKLGVSAQELVQLVAGFLPIGEVLESKRRIINGEGLDLLRAMFPKRVSHVWMMDRF